MEKIVAGEDPKGQGRESLFFVFLRLEKFKSILERSSQQRKGSFKVAKKRGITDEKGGGEGR